MYFLLACVNEKEQVKYCCPHKWVLATEEIKFLQIIGNEGWDKHMTHTKPINTSLWFWVANFKWFLVSWGTWTYLQGQNIIFNEDTVQL